VHNVRGGLIRTARACVEALYGLDAVGDVDARRDLLGRLLDTNAYIQLRADRGLPPDVCGGSLSWRCYWHRLQQRASFFLAEEIPLFLFRHFFSTTRQRATRGAGWYTALTTDISPVLVCFACTALHHALEEWHRNGGRRPAPQPGRRLKSGFYEFGEGCDRGNILCCPARRVLWANVHTRRV
jgi:hypothetical protein